MIALLGGEGIMPKLVIDNIHSCGKKVFLIAIKESTPMQLTYVADDVVWLSITHVGKAIKECVKRHIHEIVMAGRIDHNRIFSLSLLNMDLTTLKLWWNLPDLRTDNLLKAIAEAFLKKGIIVLDSAKFLKKYLAKEGTLTKVKPSKKIMDNIFFGIKIAKELGRIDIGQTVVIKNKSIVAIEAMEGTDHCLQRAGDIAGEGCIAIKMPKPNQDMRFDVPVIGKNTIQKLGKIKALGIVIETGKTLLIDPDIIDEANRLGIFIISIPKDQTESY